MLTDFTSWFSSLDLLLQIFWACAIASSLFFIVQFVLTMMGIGDADVDVDGMDSVEALSADGGMSLFTVKNVIHFFLGLGWSGVCFWDLIPSRVLLIFVSVLIGLLMVAIFLFIFKKMLSIESRGSYDPKAAVGKVCDVYLNIPEARSGKGKVQLAIQGTVIEMDALTDGERLKNQTKVRILELLDNNTVLVEKI